MKKIVLFLAALMFVVVASAQTNQIKDNGFVNVADVAKYASANYVYKIANMDRYYIHFQFNMDSISGTDASTGGTFTLSGSLDGTDYKQIATTTYTATGSSSDTTVFNIGTTALGYRYLKAAYTLTDTLQVGHTIRIVSDNKR